MSGLADNRAEAARCAMAALNEALSHRPVKTGHDFSAAQRCLTALRDSVIMHHREQPSAESRERLARLNAVISVVYGGQFPIGAVPWDSIEQARDALARLLAEMGLGVDRAGAQS